MYGGSSDEDEGTEGYRKGGYHAVRIGDRFSAGRYVAQRKLGWGNFSTVWLAYDTLCSKFVAIKIQKSAKEYSEAALHEVQILTEIAKGDPQNSKCVIHLLDHFRHRGPNGHHHCIVTEFLGDSLLNLIRHNRKKGLPLNHVKKLCKSILAGLNYLHNDLHIMHTDLKPENVLLISSIDPTKDPFKASLTPILTRPDISNHPKPVISDKWLKARAMRAVARISQRRVSLGGMVDAEDNHDKSNLEGIDMRCKIVDLGNGIRVDKEMMIEEIQTRQYRAPEVIIGSGFGFPADMWSFGCLVFELATGELLFTPKSSNGFTEDEDHLAQMMELLGKIPKEIATGGARSAEYFNKYGDLKRIRRLKFWPTDRLLIEKYKFTELDACQLADFLCPLLDFEPEKRPTAIQCLTHSWLAGGVID